MRTAQARRLHGSGTRGAARRALLAAVLGLGLAVLALGLAELGLRRAGYGGAPGDLYFTRLGERVLEPGMFAPHRERFFTLRAGYRRSAEHAGPNAIDAWPFRGRPLAPAPADAWKVAVFGDSCAYGLPLPANQALPALLDAALHQRLGDARALVANLGVPGYSTVQIRALVEEVLERFAPDEVVLYPAAWNDQAPSMGKNDVALRAELAAFAPLWDSGLAAALRKLTGAEPPPLPADGKAAAAAFGSRVPEAAVEGEVRAMIQACLARGVGVVVIVPPHPEHFRASHPRMFRDAESVRRAARALDVALIDEQARFGPAEVEHLYFADLVHPAPEGNRVLAELVAEVLAPRAPAPPAWTKERTLAVVAVRRAPELGYVDRELGDVAPELGDFAPELGDVAPELGDVALEIELAGWDAGTPLPAITVGGAALLTPTARGGGTVRGVLPRLAPGPAEVVVQTTAAIARGAAPLAIVAIEPARLVMLDVDPRDADPRRGAGRVRVTSRPGDLARVFVATARREHALYSSRGAMWIDEASCLPLEVKLTCGADGSGEAALPALEGDGPLHAQALVVPRSEPPQSAFATWSTPARIR